MRDHPSHSHYGINSGMWVSTSDAMPNMYSLFLMQPQQNGCTENIEILNTVIWKKEKASVYRHDLFSCGRLGVDHLFPINCAGLEYVGSV